MRLSQQQLLQIRLLEMPLTELEENINAELDDNPALEKVDNDSLSLDEERHEEDNEPTDFANRERRAAGCTRRRTRKYW